MSNPTCGMCCKTNPCLCSVMLMPVCVAQGGTFHFANSYDCSVCNCTEGGCMDSSACKYDSNAGWWHYPDESR